MSDAQTNQLNPKNIVKEIELLKRKVRALEVKPVKVESVDKIASRIGELDYEVADADGNIRVIITGHSLFDDYGVPAYILAMDVSANPKFYVDADDGTIWAEDGIFDGTITAHAGEIGGFTISDTYLIHDDAGLVDALSAGISPADYPFYAGKLYANRATAPFRVTTAGALFATGATISGTITATAGTIGGFTITTTRIASTHLYIDNAGEYISFGATPPTVYGANVGAWMGYSTGAKLSLYSDASNYFQFDGSKVLVKAANFTLDTSGNITASNVTLSGAITATSGAIGGFIIAATRISSTHLVIDNTGECISLGTTPPTAYGANVGAFIEGANAGRMSFYKDASNYFQWDSNKVLIKAANFTLDTSGNLTAASATLSGAITANTGFIGGASGWVIAANTIKDVAGTTGLSNVVTGGDDIRFWAGNVVPASAPFYVTESGVLVASSATITGAITATSGSIGGWTVTSTRIASTHVLIDNAGEYISFGATPPTSYGNNVGIWIGVSTVAKMSLYKDANNYLQYDGTNVTWKGANAGLDASGNLTATGGVIGGWTLAATSLIAGTGSNTVGLDSGGTNPALYAGSATPGAAPFRVTKAGALTATSGAVGGWTLGATTLVGGSLTLDSTGKIYAGATAVLTNNGFWFDYNAGTPVARVGTITTGALTKGYYWDGSNLQIKATNFTLDASGNLTASSVVLSGAITATSGAIGGWTVSSTAIQDTAGLTGMSSAVTAGNDIRFWAGNATPASAPFQVYENGAVTASSITIAGTSTIAGWNIDSTRIYKFSSASIGVILDSSTPAIKVGDTAGTYILIDGANQRIRSSNYSAGTIGSNWDTSTGNAEFNNVTVRGAIAVTTIQYGYVTAHGGTDWIVPATGVLRDDCTSVNSPTTFAVNVKDPDGMSHAAAGAQWTVNDIIRLKEPLTGDLWASISSKTDNTTYWTLNVVKQNPGAGTNYTFRAGLAIIDYGVSGSGFISLSADASMGATPNITLGTHAGSPWTTTTNQMRMGNLNGSYGYATNVYGMGVGSYGVAGQPSLTVDTTSGIRIISNTTTIGQWDTSGNITVGQVAASQNNILISSGALSIRNNTTVLANWASTGIITVGQVAASQNNIVISSGAISISNNTTERIGISAAGILTIKDSGGNAVLTFDASTGAEITKKLTMSGASSAISIGTTPPTSATVGTGIWIDRTGVYSLSTNVQNATLTSAGLSAAAGAVLIDAIGIKLKSDTYPGSGYLYWKSADTNVLTGEVISDYAGAAVNTGIRVIGQAHDSGVTGYAGLIANNESGTTKSSFVIVSDGSAQLDLTPVIGAAGAQYLNIATKTTATNVPNSMLRLITRTSGVVANGLGSAMEYFIQNSAGADKSAGYTSIAWTDKTATSEDSQFGIGLLVNGASTTLLSLDSVAGLVITGKGAFSSDFSINTNKFTVAAASGNTTIAGTLTVTGAFVTPNLGTPSAGLLTNATGLPLTSGVTGILPVANGGTGVNTPEGTYTPTATNTTNVSATTVNVTGWFRIGNKVTVFGQISPDPVAAGACLIGISLPVASSLANSFELGGAGVFSATSVAVRIIGDATNDRATFEWSAPDGTARPMSFTFSYQVI